MRRPILILVVALVLAACRQVQAPAQAPVLATAQAVQATVQATAQAPAQAPVQATALAAPAADLPAGATAAASRQPPQVAAPSAASTPPATAAAAAGVKTVLPETNWEEWDVYTAALRPAAAQNLDLKGLTQYHIFVTLPADLKTVDGVAYIHYTNRSPDTLDAVYLHLYPNLWGDGMTVSDVEAGGLPATTTLESNGLLLRVQPPRPLAPGATVDLSMSFREPVPDRDMGNFADFANMGDILALAHFYPTMVVYDKGWHLETPSEDGDVLFHQASLYDVVLSAPGRLTVAATGAMLSRTDNGDGRATWHLAGGPMRDFNITASARFEKATAQVGEITVNSYFRSDHSTGGEQALGWAEAALRTYQPDFGNYPYRELDVVETGTSAGGIEYPGLVGVASRYYTDTAMVRSFESATVHEVAHQWWYNVVGNDQVNDPWLDESTAQYATYLYYEKVYGLGGALGFQQSLEARWQRVNNEDKPIGLPVTAYDQAEYGAIVYGRGPLFFTALQYKLGQPAMLKFLSQYYRTYAWGIATDADFQGMLQQVSGQDLSQMFNQWVYPKK